MKQLKSALEARQADIKTKSAAAQQSEEQVKRLEQMLRESQVALWLSPLPLCCCLCPEAASRCRGPMTPPLCCCLKIAALDCLKV